MKGKFIWSGKIIKSLSGREIESKELEGWRLKEASARHADKESEYSSISWGGIKGGEKDARSSDGRHTFDDMINTWIELSETCRVSASISLHVETKERKGGEEERVVERWHNRRETTRVANRV